jgi:hypothetical protein
MSTEAKIFGERNTGTNALKALIESNSSTKVCPSVAAEVDPHLGAKLSLLQYAPRRYRKRIREAYVDRLFQRTPARMAWKHAATRFGEIGSLDGCPVILMTRHPASWLLGLHRHPYHSLGAIEPDFVAFLGSRWRLLKRDNLAEGALSPPELWNAKARSNLQLMEQLSRRGMPFKVVRFEDFVADQTAVFQALKDLLSNPAEKPRVIERSTKDTDKTYEFYQSYYGSEAWVEEISDEGHEIIKRSIDWRVASEFGYS